MPRRARLSQGRRRREEGRRRRELAEVSFSVNFAQKGTLKPMVLKETSTFRKTDEGAWLYAKGDVITECRSRRASITRRAGAWNICSGPD